MNVSDLPSTAARTEFERRGFYVTPPFIPPDLIERATRAMDEVIAGNYETGVPPPYRFWNPGDPTDRLIKIEDPHCCNRAIFELVTHPELGRWIAALTGAEMVQVWNVGLLYKPPSPESAANVGWHRDNDYYGPSWVPGSQVLMAWIALTDVDLDCGPIIYIPGSHRWGEVGAGDFFDTDMERLRANYHVPPDAVWEEVPATMPAGAATVHSVMTIHGSGPNFSGRPRRSFGIALRTDRSAYQLPLTEYIAGRITDFSICPVIHGPSDRVAPLPVTGTDAG